jgi:RimJ/RimL family protein N-acetyltransferase
MDSGRDTDPLEKIHPPARIDDRVTIRYRLDDGSATDVVGWITRLGAEQVEVFSPGGRHTLVDRGSIILARRVPPARGGRPPERWTADELETAAAPGWIADHEPLGAWLLRSGNGFTGRANSCLAVGDPGVPYHRAAKIIVDFYTGLGLPPRVQTVTGGPVDRALRDLGWVETYVATTVMTSTLAGLLGDHPRNPQVKINSELTEDWWQSYLQYREVGDHQVARRILGGPQPVGLAEIRDDDVIVSLGRGQVSDEWLGLAGLWTRPDHRRRGLATMIMIELGHWAARLGARNVYLQVDQQNAGAIAAYASLGFVRHHDYCYLSPS